MLQSPKGICWHSGPTLTVSLLLLWNKTFSCILSFPHQRSTRWHFSMQGLCCSQPRAVSQIPATTAQGRERAAPAAPKPTHPSSADAEGGLLLSLPQQWLVNSVLKGNRSKAQHQALINTQESVHPLLVHYICFASITQPRRWEPAERAQHCWDHLR